MKVGEPTYSRVFRWLLVLEDLNFVSRQYYIELMNDGSGRVMSQVAGHEAKIETGFANVVDLDVQLLKLISETALIHIENKA